MIYVRFVLLVWIIVSSALICVGLVLSFFKHETDVNSQANHVLKNQKMEIIWLLIPFIIIFSLAYPSVIDYYHHQTLVYANTIRK